MIDHHIIGQTLLARCHCLMELEITYRSMRSPYEDVRSLNKSQAKEMGHDLILDNIYYQGFFGNGLRPCITRMN